MFTKHYVFFLMFKGTSFYTVHYFYNASRLRWNLCTAGLTSNVYKAHNFFLMFKIHKH